MFAQQKGPRSASRAAKEDHSSILFIAAAVGIGAIFATAYHVGTGRQRKIGERKSYDLHLRGEHARKQLRECHNKTSLSSEKAAGLKGESAELWNNNKQLEEENARLVKLNSELEEKNVGCAENAELQKQSWKREDKKYFKKLFKLDTANRVLRMKAKRLSSAQGMRTILLLATIKKLAAENEQLRQQSRLSLRTMSQQYIDELVQKWNTQDPEAMARQRGEVLPPLLSEMRKKKAKILDHYDPDKHGTAIFLPKKDEDGEWRLPGWAGRYGTQTLRHGTFVDSKLCPVTSISRQMRVLYEYALCAVGNNVTQLMYPTSFKRCKECHTEYLHNYIESPLVLFCDDCRPMHNTNEFKLLCQGFSSDEQYGTKLFWRTRSRLRFKGRFLNLAEEWADRKRFGRYQTLAVRLPRGDDHQRACAKAREHRREILTYSRLLKGKATELSGADEFDLQCMPPWRHVYKNLNEIVSQVAKDKSTWDLKVYVSSDMSEEEWVRLKKNVPAKLIRRLPTGRPTEDDIVDTYIAAGAGHVILNRYDIKSAHINEAHMLLNELQIAGMYIW